MNVLAKLWPVQICCRHYVNFDGCCNIHDTVWHGIVPLVKRWLQCGTCHLLAAINHVHLIITSSKTTGGCSITVTCLRICTHYGEVNFGHDYISIHFERDYKVFTLVFADWAWWITCMLLLIKQVWIYSVLIVQHWGMGSVYLNLCRDDVHKVQIFV